MREPIPFLVFVEIVPVKTTKQNVRAAGSNLRVPVNDIGIKFEIAGGQFYSERDTGGLVGEKPGVNAPEPNIAELIPVS